MILKYLMNPIKLQLPFQFMETCNQNAKYIYMRFSNIYKT